MCVCAIFERDGRCYADPSGMRGRCHHRNWSLAHHHEGHSLVMSKRTDEQMRELERFERVAECKRIVEGASGYTSIERAVAQRMLDTIYKEAQ